MTLERSERRLPITPNQYDILYYLSEHGACNMNTLINFIEGYEDDVVGRIKAISSVVAQSKIQGLIEPTDVWREMGKTKWRITQRGKVAVNSYYGN